MNESKKGYSSNIIVAIAALIVLWGIIDTVKFWLPFIGSADIESLVKAHDPYKTPADKEEDFDRKP